MVELVFMWSGVCLCAQKERTSLSGIGYEGTVNIWIGDAIIESVRYARYCEAVS